MYRHASYASSSSAACASSVAAAGASGTALGAALDGAAGAAAGTAGAFAAGDVATASGAGTRGGRATAGGLLSPSCHPVAALSSATIIAPRRGQVLSTGTLEVKTDELLQLAAHVIR